MTLDRDTADRLAAAKLWLTSSDAADMPYLSTALYSLVPVATDRVATMTLDQRWRLYLNPAWIAATPVPTIGVHLAHLTWHLLAEHADRARDMHVTSTTQQSWEKAADLTIHTLLERAGLLRDSASDPASLPPLPAPATEGLPADRSAEEYFTRLSRLPVTSDTDDLDQDATPPTVDHGCGSACDGQSRGYELTSAPGLDQGAAQSIRERVAIEFRAHQSGRGTLPGEWQRWVEQVLEPVVDWRLALAAGVRRGLGWASGHTDYTYSRISRRHAASPGVVLPALRRRVPRVAVVVDTSGSMDDGLLSQALAEIDGVLKSGGIADNDVTVLAVDAAVHEITRVRDASTARLAGGGGTDMTVGIDAALATTPRPELVIVLTDGITPWPATPTPVPLIAAILWRGRGAPPTPAWLQRIVCAIE
jgi:predicted metal-dependent peptidase